MLMKNKKIRNTPISLDGGTFENCDFDKCEIIYSGYLPVRMDSCKFGPDVKWSLSGPASNTINFMRGIYAQGAKSLIENTFETIRGSPSAGGPTLH